MMGNASVLARGYEICFDAGSCKSFNNSKILITNACNLSASCAKDHEETKKGLSSLLNTQKERISKQKKKW
jgi:Na+-transporting NADH:ubiquinone oxidoreductase subunit NqrF